MKSFALVLQVAGCLALCVGAFVLDVAAGLLVSGAVCVAVGAVLEREAP